MLSTEVGSSPATGGAVKLKGGISNVLCVGLANDGAAGADTGCEAAEVCAAAVDVAEDEDEDVKG